MYDGILFDVDGVLVANPPDHPEPYSEAAAKALRSFGIDPEPEDLEPFYGPGKSLDGMRKVCDRHGLDVSDVWPERERCATDLQQRMIEEGVRELHEHANVIEDLAETHDIALVSNNQIATIEFFAEFFGFDHAVETIEARRPSVEGFSRGKPEPYYLEQALEDLDVDSAVMIGDRASDVVAAHTVGIDSVFVRRDDEVEFSVPPTYEVDALDELPGLLAGPTDGAQTSDTDRERA